MNFNTEKRIFDCVTPEQLTLIKKHAKKCNGRVKIAQTGFGNKAVKVQFTDSFPVSFASHDVRKFDDMVKPLNLERFTGIPSLVGL
jgi:hypothetical protein